MNFANTPSFANQGLSPAGRLTLCVLASIALLIGDSHFGLMDRARNAISVLLYPVQRAANLPLAAGRHIGDFFVTQAELKQDNDRLRSVELAQSGRLMRLQSLERELAQLKALNQLKVGRSEGGQLAEVLYTARDPFSYKIIIDKGQDAGVKAGLPVIDEIGLIGQVTRVQPLTSEITLIVNKNEMVPVMNLRTSQRTLLYGYGGGIEVRYLSASSDIRPGDELVTSGLDGMYQAGIPVARVTHVDRPAGAAFARVLCQSLAGVQSSRYVMVMPEQPLRPPQPAPLPEPASKKKKPSNEDDAG
ncbi:rod shape-determining protein MreC [Vogesella sp. LIG4]|uniref:rod shape-determining protein MreC n=1 Tax=Vogesella sp. LIG4 TaxID=1192162 RepID=UPI00082006BD|nr:rod shape-determining protein MreC [Vogesella sp. LIG4]SCK10978.1 rod shape-determining protein MreC [Vogesella sp. LIG4]